MEFRTRSSQGRLHRHYSRLRIKDGEDDRAGGRSVALWHASRRRDSYQSGKSKQSAQRCSEGLANPEPAALVQGRSLRKYCWHPCSGGKQVLVSLLLINWVSADFQDF